MLFFAKVIFFTYSFKRLREKIPTKRQNQIKKYFFFVIDEEGCLGLCVFYNYFEMMFGYDYFIWIRVVQYTMCPKKSLNVLRKLSGDQFRYNSVQI